MLLKLDCLLIHHWHLLLSEFMAQWVITQHDLYKGFFSNKSLISLALIIYGDMQNLLAAAIGAGRSGQTFLHPLDLEVNGKLSLSSAHFLERGLLGNFSLKNLGAFVYGELPDNWETFVSNLRVAERSQVSFTFHPDTCSTVAGNQIVPFCSCWGWERVSNGTAPHCEPLGWAELWWGKSFTWNLNTLPPFWSNFKRAGKINRSQC